MSKEIYTPPVPIDSVRSMLDVMVDQRCENFYEEWLAGSPFSLDPEADQFMPYEHEAVDEALLQLVFKADARAQADNDQFNVVNNIAWAGVAREAILRMTRRHGESRDLRKMRIFVGSDLAMQAGAYKDMADRRVTAEGKAVRSCIGLEYATKVALGDVMLEARSTPVR